MENHQNMHFEEIFVVFEYLCLYSEVQTSFKFIPHTIIKMNLTTTSSGIHIFKMETRSQKFISISK